MTTILDPLTDTLDIGLYLAVQTHEAPAYVKQASAEELRGCATTRGDLFADPQQRRFPTHAAAATWYSAALFREGRDQLPEAKQAQIHSRLCAAAQFWGITSDVDALLQPVKAAELDAPDEPYPLRNPEEIKAAASWLVSQRDVLPLPEQRQLARRILQKSAAFSSEEELALTRTAGYGTCASSAAADLLDDRGIRLARLHPELSQELRKTAANLRAQARPLSPEEATYWADQVTALDTHMKWARLYAGEMTRPVDALFGVTEGDITAHLNERVKLASGSVYRLADLAPLSHAAVRDEAGQELADAAFEDLLWRDTASLATKLAGLDAEHAQLFDRVCQALAVPAEITGKARFGADLAALASAF